MVEKDLIQTVTKVRLRPKTKPVYHVDTVDETIKSPNLQ